MAAIHQTRLFLFLTISCPMPGGRLLCFLSAHLRPLPVFCGRNAHDVFEGAHKVAVIVEAAHVGNLREAHLWIAV